MIRCGMCKETHPTVADVKACWAEACYWGNCSHRVCKADAEARWVAEAAAEAAAERAAERYWEEGTSAEQVRRMWEDDMDARMAF
jgi:hypothetical protein